MHTQNDNINNNNNNNNLKGENCFVFISSESINMLYFNKTAEDIWCRSNLDSLADKNKRYKFV